MKGPKAPRSPGSPKSKEKAEPQGPSLNQYFKDYTEYYAQWKGVPLETAQKEATLDFVGKFGDAAVTEGVLTSKSDIYQLFNEALKAQMKHKEIAALAAEGQGHPDFRPFSLLPAAPEELMRTQRRLEALYEGAQVRPSVVIEYNNLNRELIEITRRLHGDADFRAAADMAEVQANHPHLMADIARMLEIQQRMIAHEGQLEAQIRSREAMDNLSETAGQYLTEGIAKPVFGWLLEAKKTIDSLGKGKSLFSDLPAFMALTAALVPAAFTFGKETIKLAARGVQAVYAEVKAAR